MKAFVVYLEWNRDGKVVSLLSDYGGVKEGNGVSLKNLNLSSLEWRIEEICSDFLT